MNRHMQLAARLAHNTSRGKPQVNIQNNTVAHWECPPAGNPANYPITVRFHTTDILLAYPNGMVEALSGTASFTTRVRHKEYMAHGWSTFQKDGSTFLSHASVLMHFERGCVTGWCTRPIVELNLRCRLGDSDAADELAGWLADKSKGDKAPPPSSEFDARHDVCPRCGIVEMPSDLSQSHVCGLVPLEAWARMAQTVRDYRGTRYGGSYKTVKESLAVFDDPDAKGRWLVKEATGEMVRALTRGDLVRYGVNDDTKTVSYKGELHLLVDGFTYSARSA